MPKPKRAKFGLRRKQARKKARNKNIRLTETERMKLAKFKIQEGELRDEIERQRGYLGTWKNKRDLEDVAFEHGRNRHLFEKTIKELAKKFPGEEIVVVDEGAGESTLFEELPQAFRGKVKVRVERTDIDRYGVDKHQTSPEELVKRFGKNSVHLVISTFGGVSYTPISQAKAVANIIEILKPGGEAKIVTATAPYFTDGSRLRVTKLRKILKQYRNIQVSEEIVTDQHTIRITIKKLK